MQVFINATVFMWFATYTVLCHAANTTLAQDVLAYDWLSLFFAAAAGLLGGAGRTILTLISSASVVGNVKVVLMKDLLVALIGGAIIFLVIQAWNVFAESAGLFTIQRDIRVLFLVLAGASRGRWFGVIDRFASEAIENARKKILGQQLPPPVVAVPPSETEMP